MIEKISEFFQEDYDFPLVTVLDSSNKELVKTANYAGEVSSFLSGLNPEPEYIYALINALTAGEFYGSNRNGDYFPEEALKKYHNTFVENGYVYKHHVNKDPLKSFGKVIFSHYNDEMKRVELVVRLIKAHEETQKIIAELQRSGPAKIKTSMGCRVPEDICSITLKRAKTRDQYSDYLKHKMNQVLEDGRKVYAINEKPRFFDISIVVIPADPVSSFMKTIGLEKTAELQQDEKSAQIKKIINGGGSLDFLEEDPKELILKSQERIPEDILKKLAEYPMNEVLSTMLALRIFPLREDFQKLALYSQNQFELANSLEKQNLCFSTEGVTIDSLEKVGEDFAKEKIAELFSKNIFEYSLTKPYIINRILEKSASWADGLPEAYPAPQQEDRSFINKMFFNKTPSPPDSGVKDPTGLFITLGTLYAGYARLFKDSANLSEFSKFIGKNPWVGPLLGLGLGVRVNEVQKEMLHPVNTEIYGPTMRKTASLNPEKFFGALLVGVPASYYYAGTLEQKARQGQPLSKVENFARENPFITGFGATLTGRGMYKGIKKSIKKIASASTSNFTNSDNPELINIIYNEIIS